MTLKGYKEKVVEKEKILLLPALSLFFPTLFSKYLCISVFKIPDCLMKGLPLLPNDKTLDSTKLKAFAADKINVTQML